MPLAISHSFNANQESENKQCKTLDLDIIFSIWALFSKKNFSKPVSNLVKYFYRK